MVQVILVRHGETDWNRSRRVQGGGSDTYLNNTGKEQAEALAERFKPETIQAVYSSPLQRALHTAQAIARHHRLEVQVEPALSELNVGKLEGTQVESLGKRLDELLTVPGQDKTQEDGKETLWRKIEDVGGESLAELQRRAWGTIQHIVNRHPDSVIVAVSHYFTILTIICAVLDLPLSQIGRFRLGVSGVSTIVFDGPVARLTSFSDICHLNT
ncbi:histidine phosphatase family protein [Chloroflexota bacterium]